MTTYPQESLTQCGCPNPKTGQLQCVHLTLQGLEKIRESVHMLHWQTIRKIRADNTFQFNIWNDIPDEIGDLIRFAVLIGHTHLHVYPGIRIGSS